ncbi:MAG: carboxypeptidase-like regulatory domain-containing protein, partial [Planctomycetota bacterium]
GLATVRAPILAGPLPPEPLLVFVGPAREYAGRVLDPEGLPIGGAEVAVYLDEGLAGELTPGTIAASMAAVRTTSDSAGHFALALGFAEGNRLKAGAEGFRSTELELPAQSNTELALTLAPVERLQGLYAGRVLHADGRPAAGAYVATGEDSVRADQAGHFVLTPGEGEEPTHLRAALPGFLPAELVLADLRADEREALELVLGGPGLTLAGRVLDADGAALADVRVWTDDGERFGSVLTRVGDISFNIHYDVEGLIDGVADGQKDGREVRSAADGSFELTGLVARRYRLWALHPRTFERLGPLEIAAGARGVELVLAGRERLERVAGRVTSYSGAPLAGVNVSVARQYRGDSGSLHEHRDHAQARVTTDAEGRFEFPALCVDGTLLQFTAADATSETPLELARVADLEKIELALPAVCHLRVMLDDPARADSLELENAEGDSLMLTFQLGGVLCSSAGVQLFDGKSERITTDESAVLLVLRKVGAEVERIPLRLEPGRLNELRF